MLAHDSEVSLSCDDCSLSFKTQSDMNIHYESSHNNTGTGWICKDCDFQGNTWIIINSDDEMISFLKSEDSSFVYSAFYELIAIAKLFNVYIHIFTYEGVSRKHLNWWSTWN